MIQPGTTVRSMLVAALGAVLLATSAGAQDGPRPADARDTLLAAARDIMAAARFAALVTLDSAGHPQARAMDPFVADEEFVVWIGTNRRTRKVGEIQRDGRVALYYFDEASASYVTIRGTARVESDPAETARHWKPEWEAFYPNRTDYVLIAVTPRRLEIVSPGRGIVGDPVTWAPPTVTFR